MGTLEVPYRPIKRRVSDSRSTGLCGGLHLTRQWVDRRCQQSLPALRKRGLVCRAAEIDLDMLLPQNCYRLTKPQLQQWLKERDLPSTGRHSSEQQLQVAPLWQAASSARAWPRTVHSDQSISEASSDV